MTKAEGKNQRAEYSRGRASHVPAFWLLLSASILLLTAGCSERSSGAARPAVLTAADSTGAENAAPRDSVASAGQKRARDITFDTIKFDMQKDEPFQRSMITPAIEKLDKAKICIRGYILPSVQQTLSQFVLVRDNMQCCFGPGAALFDCIVVELDAGHTTEFTTQPVAVEGVFSVSELRNPEGKCLAIYHLQAQKVQ